MQRKSNQITIGMSAGLTVRPEMIKMVNKQRMFWKHIKEGEENNLKKNKKINITQTARHFYRFSISMLSLYVLSPPLFNSCSLAIAMLSCFDHKCLRVLNNRIIKWNMCGWYVFELCFIDCEKNLNDLAIKQKYFEFYWEGVVLRSSDINRFQF